MRMTVNMKYQKMLCLQLNIFVLNACLLPNIAAAQIAAGGLGSRVNGSAYGSCTAGSCAISGGSRSGSNLLHRLSSFDTRNRINSVKLDTQGLKNVILGVTNGSGSYLNKHFSLSAPANFFLLSPGGIWIGPGARFTNAQNLLVTTAYGMQLGNKYFDALTARKGDIYSLNQPPNISFSKLKSNDGNPNNLGLTGSGSIILEGGHISVDQNLLLNATSGHLITVPGSTTKLHAGSSIWLAGHQVDLKDASITAGVPGNWGLIDVRSSLNQAGTQQGSIHLDRSFLKGQQISLAGQQVDLKDASITAGEPGNWGLIDMRSSLNQAGTQQGSIHLDRSLLKAQQIWLAGHQVELKDASITAGEPGNWGLIDVQSSLNQDGSQQGSIHLDRSLLKGREILMTAGRIFLNKSNLEAPKGEIQLAATSRSGPANSLSIDNSVLNVSAYDFEDLSAPAPMIDSEQIFSIENKQGRIKLPTIALFSKQDIYISNDSLLNASLDVSAFLGKQSPGEGLDMNKVADRSGLVFLRADGKISLNSSTVLTDSSNNLAGKIYMEANRTDHLGGIFIGNSKLLSRYGAADGEITLVSKGGIAIKNSTLDVSSNHFPIVNGKTSVLTTDGLKFFAFKGGEINMQNKSAALIQIDEESKLLARQSTDGGGIESPLFGFSQQPDVGTYGSLYAFTKGVDYDTGGSIIIQSDGGIKISSSYIDASSGDAPYENTAGTISFLDKSKTGIELRYSFLGAIAGEPLDIGNKESKAGSIFLTSKEGTLVVDNSSVFASNLRTSEVLPASADYDNPWIRIESAGTMKVELLDSIFQASKYGDPPLYPPFTIIADVVETTIQTLSDPEYQQTGPDGFAAFDLINLFNLAFMQKTATIESIYGISGLETVTDGGSSVARPQLTFTNPSIQISTLSSPPVLKTSLLSSRDPESTPISVDLNNTSPQFLESQNRSLIETTKALGLPSGSGRLKSIAELQQKLSLARQIITSTKRLAPPLPAQTSAIVSSVNPYTPAILHLRRDNQPSGTTRLSAILLTAQGEPISSSQDVPRADLDRWIRNFQRQLSRRSPQPGATTDPGQKLSQALIAPLLPSLRQQGITALLLEVDRGLQAIPYGALPVQLQGRDALLSDGFAITITPSLGLIDLDPHQKAPRPQHGKQASNDLLLLAGASQFSNGLSPLPMVRQELQALSQEHPSQLLLNETFTPAALIDQSLATPVRQLHIATHATFLPGESSSGLLYTPTSSLSLADLGRRLRSRNSSSPLDLLTLSGCVTALGDEQSELGFVGMALQAGARSGLGTLWEVDDTATAAFFIQLYRYLKLGLPKDQALQATQQAFLRGEVQLEGDRLVGPDQLKGPGKTTLVSGLSREEQTLFSRGLSHPYYWAGMVLSGSPW
jgi:filamentous hemagglutinin family protein